ncbi:hypothetical protein FIV42_12315 [Persicimonas caeni]|uniref:SMP-30/Gluconolactonase/LRE-like region domain-containing protein n=1 Tax=Persicimonas caeni TaxID=2292766 RepID=A0A4Y6PTC5_PERCE|nr:putative metal-binding motif-containing protein [Persicimonas caeni]QDG51500.1 hypothetical protein FIV42_12315 [Persicimonas caeni]QED32721.1 hypothetical protein FRD00_12310 [Persicimonas caeni]
MSRHWTVLIAALVVCSLAGCSDDANDQISCDSDELYDHVNDECVPRGTLSESDADSSDAADAGDITETPDTDETDDTGADVEPDVTEEDVSGDVEADVDLDECDKDRDGALAESCGGYDCDDNDPARSPYYNEFCDTVDNNCSGVVNDNITCTFYAHAGPELYEIDPFAKTATSLGAVQFQNDDLYLQDMDTHPDGTLFGITRDGVYRFDQWADGWVFQGDFGMDVGDPNGLAIDSTGTAFITSQDKVYSADLRTGRATLLGTTGSFYSSGDCVVNKRDTLFLTSKEEGQSDKLVQVSRQSGQGTAVGEIGYDSVFALTAAWGTLYGLTNDGELIEIDQHTGAGTLVHTFSGIGFWGAASTPNR